MCRRRVLFKETEKSLNLYEENSGSAHFKAIFEKNPEKIIFMRNFLKNSRRNPKVKLLEKIHEGVHAQTSVSVFEGISQTIHEGIQEQYLIEYSKMGRNKF